MSEKQLEDGKDKILELIRWMDKQKCKLFKKWDGFSGWWLGLIGLVVIVISVFVLNIGIFLSHITDFSVTLPSAAISLAVLGVAISFFSLAAQFSQENMVRANYNKALRLRQFNPNEKIFLKALIKIKAKNSEFELEELYNKDETLFTKEKLLERLCG